MFEQRSYGWRGCTIAWWMNNEPRANVFKTTEFSIVPTVSSEIKIMSSTRGIKKRVKPEKGRSSQTWKGSPIVMWPLWDHWKAMFTGTHFGSQMNHCTHSCQSFLLLPLSQYLFYLNLKRERPIAVATPHQMPLPQSKLHAFPSQVCIKILSHIIGKISALNKHAFSGLWP